MTQQHQAPGPYGLRPPSVTEARASLYAVFGAQTDEIWQRLTHRAGMPSTGGDDAALPRLMEAMRADHDPVVALCAQSLHIRLSTYQHLTAAHETIRSAQ
ncbi:hypothetical protein Daura_26385 [Dactylosporangium aurantiacum]|uniref:Uncharacterized protein n=1 Tax=Dactylosporangium aurantiacum TaxID=35754 RepID=A0A9Q9I675_9ACTN|nr:hypothetical protein [Dactylosporangium aurantiacum]MDG6109282.1 hypothetical protein [Dactylosporangium aurantiacum]UWZ50369.1 hypothetical protein Daura_26385 [Dactylosporangium aurantiacum]